MRRSRLACFGFAFSLAAFSICLAAAQADDAAPAANPRALLDKLVATQAAAKSYQMAATWNIEMIFLGQQVSMSLRTEVAYQKPNLFRARFAETVPDQNGKPQPGDTLVAVCDGKQFFVDATRFGTRKIVVAPAPTDLLKVKLNDMVGMGSGGGGKPEGDTAIPDFLSVHDGTFDPGRIKSVTAGYNHNDPWLKTLKEPKGCVAMTLQLVTGPPFVLWIDPRDCTLRQVALSLSGADQAAAQPKPKGGQADAKGLADLLKAMSMHMLITADKVVYDAPIPAATFVYKPPAGATVTTVKSVEDLANAIEPSTTETQGGKGTPAAKPARVPKPHPKTPAWQKLEQMVKAYRSAKTYVEQGGVVWETTSGGKVSRLEMPYKIVYEAPNKLWARGGGDRQLHVVACDGHTLYLQRAPFDKVAKAPAPAKLLDNENLWEAFSTPDLPGCGPDFIDCLSGDFSLDNVEDVHEGLPKGKAWFATLPNPRGTTALTLTMGVRGMPSPVVIWIDDSLHVVRQWACVFVGPADSKEDGARWVASANRVVLNQPIPPEVFVYKLPKDMRVVDAGGLGSMMKAIVAQPGGQPPEGKSLAGKAPMDFTAVGLDGRPVVLSSFKGKPIVLDFWTTWCPGCRAELPVLEEEYTKLKAQGLEVVAVALDQSRDAVKKFLGENKHSFTVLWLDASKAEGKRVVDEYGINGIPRTLFIGPDWVIKRDNTGFGGKEEILGALKALGLKVD